MSGSVGQEALHSSRRTTDLARIETVDLREVWPTEAGHFTPWLAEEDNLSLLGHAIGIELELEAQEKQVGPFWADILCKDAQTDNWVLIENQLEKTDHTHLGQLLTYAAGLKAATIVWIASSFEESHRAALDWLNEITGEDFNFFGVKVELWRIADSPCAPRFNVVSQPNDWSRTVAKGASRIDTLTESGQLQLDFWRAFQSFVQGRTSQVQLQKPRPASYMVVGLGITGVHLRAVASFWNSSSDSYESNELRVELVFTTERFKELFEQLERIKPSIEAELQESLVWYKKPEVRTSRIHLRRSVDLADRSQWPDYHEWLLKNLEAFKRVFVAKLRQLRAGNALGQQPA